MTTAPPPFLIWSIVPDEPVVVFDRLPSIASSVIETGLKDLMVMTNGIVSSHKMRWLSHIRRVPRVQKILGCKKLVGEK
ncbi:hypothetical protein TNCV_3182921 [Trichonephila clavipes]|uniref:Uncharacterized protein n=1 Tax=Trichonephila clavipes TaxID=2585209 RepID=A0A8X6VL71_TRICX|nr:hypothetical protein TNCV_3182921 [Trichonephila clavipes]